MINVIQGIRPLQSSDRFWFFPTGAWRERKMMQMQSNILMSEWLLKRSTSATFGFFLLWFELKLPLLHIIASSVKICNMQKKKGWDDGGESTVRCSGGEEETKVGHLAWEDRRGKKRRKIACCTKWKPALTGLALTERITSIIKSSGVGRDMSQQQAAQFPPPDVNNGFFLVQTRCRAELHRCVRADSFHAGTSKNS